MTEVTVTKKIRKVASATLGDAASATPTDPPVTLLKVTPVERAQQRRAADAARSSAFSVPPKRSKTGRHRDETVPARAPKISGTDSNLQNASPSGEEHSSTSEDEISESYSPRIRKRRRASFDSDESSDAELRRVDKASADTDVAAPVKEQRHGLLQVAKPVYPSNISVNQKYVTLDGKISSELAVKFLNQSRIPGFAEGIHQLSTVIFEDANQRITDRLLSRESKCAEWFPNQSRKEIAQWMDHSDLHFAAKLVHALFGPSAVTQQTQADTLDSRIQNIEFGYDFDDEDFEDDCFIGVNNLLRDAQNAMQPFSAQRLQQLSLLVAARLQSDTAISSAYKERLTKLSKAERNNDTPQEVCRCIKLVRTHARNDIRQAERWLIPGSRVVTNGKGIPITSVKKPLGGHTKMVRKVRTGANVSPTASAAVAYPKSLEEVQCKRCGVYGVAPYYSTDVRFLDPRSGSKFRDTHVSQVSMAL